jgi:8-oxo-dGTP pyrophosphatase MutT (NUDIX family)
MPPVRFPRVIADIGDALTRPLPGPAAQALMAPRPRRGWPQGFDADAVRHAAGLLLVSPIDDEPHVVLTVRSARVRHSGQVSLPGGVVEAGETLEGAALREAHEEIALAIEHVRVLGALTPLDIPVSGFRLHPIVACVDRPPVLAPSDLEVDRILQVPLHALLDPSTVQVRPMTRGEIAVDAPAFVVQDAIIWGATAMVLAEFLALLGWPGPKL